MLAVCKNGHPQLSLYTTTNDDLKRAAKAQIDDWIARKRELEGTTIIRPKCSFVARY